MSRRDRNTSSNKRPTSPKYGVVEELKGFTYQFGTQDQGDLYIKTTEAITEYIGRHYPTNMVQLMEGVEAPPTEPTPPADLKDSLAMENYKQDRSHWLKKLDQYEENKGKVFNTIKSQCSASMKAKLESLADWKQIVKDNDVLKLLARIKDLCYSTSDVQYDYWVLACTLRKMTSCNQGPQETLTDYYRRWVAHVEVLEAQWGVLAPPKLKAKDQTNDKTARDKLAACLLLMGVDKPRFGKVIDDLNNNFLSGQKEYPITPQDMLQLLTYRTDSDQKKKTAAELNNIPSTSFGQLEEVVCHCCGKKGHTSKKCWKRSKPKDEWFVNKALAQTEINYDSDDDQSWGSACNEVPWYG